MEIPVTIQNLYLIYSSIVDANIESYESSPKRLVLPKVSQVFLSQICNLAANIFQKEDIILEIKDGVIVVGDLHGHILDLLRIFKQFGFPPNASYLFLGDIVDRGEFSLETVSLLFILKILFPDNIFIIRGNHEFVEMCEYCGFFEELSKVYGNKIIANSFIHAFSYLPIAAIVQKSILCVHGGIGPTLTGLAQIRNIKRPIFDSSSEPLLSILWSDPSESVNEFKPSPRGTGYLFGSEPLAKFLNYNNLKTLVRGHECVQEGAQYTHQKRCITVFSASNYCGMQPNKSAVLTINQQGGVNITRFRPTKYIKRKQVNIFSTDCKSTILSPINRNLPHLKPTPKKLDESRSSRQIKPKFGLQSVKARSIGIRSYTSLTNPRSILVSDTFKPN